MLILNEYAKLSALFGLGNVKDCIIQDQDIFFHNVRVALMQLLAM